MQKVEKGSLHFKEVEQKLLVTLLLDSKTT